MAEQPILWMFVTIFATLLLIVISVSPIQAATDETLNQNAYLQTRRIATIINLVASSPDGTTYFMSMPNQNCRILITPAFVKLDMKNAKVTSDTYGLITPNGIQSNFESDCSDRTIKIIKSNGVLKFEV